MLLSDRLATTFDLLATTENEAAVSLLAAALESRFAELRDRAIETILSRRNSTEHRILLRRLHLLNKEWRTRIRNHNYQMTNVLRDLILDKDEQCRINGCEVALWFCEYDLIPVLLSSLTDQGNTDTKLVSETLLKLVDSLYADLISSGESRPRRDPQLVRQHTMTSIESAVNRFTQHRRREVIEVFLALAIRDNVILNQILRDPHHVAFIATVDVLAKSSREGVIHLLLSLLDDPDSPSVALSIIGNRRDQRFLRYLLKKIGSGPSDMVSKNLKRMENIGWLRDPISVISELGEDAQHSVVKLVMASRAPKKAAFGVIEYLLEHGKPAGRRAAAEVLIEFDGARANELALACLDDSDPFVQANGVAQLRRRGIPGVLSRLLAMLESPYAVVRQAAQDSFGEFNFKRFLGAFDMLEEDVRRSTGMLVKRVDPQTVPLLKLEMESPMRTRRIRALIIARTIEVAAELEPSVIQLIEDQDHLVRVEAATTLSQLSSEAARNALRQALEDSSHAVREAARHGLEEMVIASAISAIGRSET